MSKTKQCRICQEEKDLGEFYRRPRRPSGYTSRCKTCISEHNKEYAATHKQEKRIRDQRRYRAQRGHLLEQSRRYHREHRVEIGVRNQQWQATHSKHRAAYNAQWREANRSKCALYSHNRRARETKAGGSYTVGEWEALLAQHPCCPCCNKPFTKVRPATIDHIKPIVAGGPNTIENIQPLCKSCNSRKGASTVDYRHTWCEWCLFVLGRIRPGNHGHHVFGKHNPVVVRLCQPHHSEAYHTGGRITRQEIVDKILIPHRWGGQDQSDTYQYHWRDP